MDVSRLPTTGLANVTTRSVAKNAGKEGTGETGDLGKIKPIWEDHFPATLSPTQSGSPSSVIPLLSFQWIDKYVVDFSLVKLNRKDKKRKIEYEFNRLMHPRGGGLTSPGGPIIVTLCEERVSSRCGTAMDEG